MSRQGKLIFGVGITTAAAGGLGTAPFQGMQHFSSEQRPGSSPLSLAPLLTLMQSPGVASTGFAGPWVFPEPQRDAFSLFQS